MMLSGCDEAWTVAFGHGKGWALKMVCANGHGARRSLQGLPDHATLGQIAERARCGACGSRRGQLYTVQDVAGSFSTAG
jgi:hypothetical protein